MPVYEFRCEECGKKVEALVLSIENQKVSCPNCKSSSLTRVMSAFAYHRSENDRLANFDTSAKQNIDSYKDDRNVGLWAKKRMKELGLEPGKEEFDGIIEKARERVDNELGG